MSKPTVSLMVAVTENGVIGRCNAMPWHLSSDLQRFKKTTWGKPVIMGRKTYQSIGQPLKGRTNIIITRSGDFAAGENVLIARSIAQAQDFATRKAEIDGVDEIFVIGGAEIFRSTLAQADRLYITEILAHIEGDTYLPAIEPDLWHCISSEKPMKAEKDSHPTRFVIYEKLKRKNTNH